MAYTFASELLAQTGGDTQWGLIALGVGIIVLGAGVIAYGVIRKRRASSNTAEPHTESDAADA